MPRRSAAGGPSASMPRSSARPSSAPAIRRRPRERWSRPGAPPRDLVEAARAPFVKICGITDEAGVRAALRGRRGRHRAEPRPRDAAGAFARGSGESRGRGAGRSHRADRRPAIVAITVDRSAADLNEIAAALDADAIQLSGAEEPALVAELDRPAWKTIHLPSATSNAPHADGPTGITKGNASLAAELLERVTAFRAAGAQRIMLDTSGGPHPGGTGRRADPALVAAIAREVPVVLAGGLEPASVGEALRDSAAVGVDVASGVETPRVQGERPRKDALKVALFAKRARAARADRPNLPSRPDAGRPVPPRGGRPRPVGHRPRVRRPLRARDADGRAPPARVCVCRAPSRPALLGGAARAPRDLRGPPDAALPRGPPRGAGPGACTRRGHGRRHTLEPPAVPQARGRGPHGRPQDQQRARPGAAHAAARQDPGHRRDRRGPARGRDRDGVRAARAALRRVHGRRGHRAPAAERASDARAWRGGPAGHVRLRDAEGRDQRRDARLGDERRVDALRARLSDGAAPVPDDRARSPASDRR